MKNIFNSVQMTRPKRNTFDLTHDIKMSGKIGELYPCMTMEVVPGDKIIIGADTLIRFAPLIAPIMHRVDVTIHYFFTPNRIVWENWENFITNTPNEQGDTPLHPYITFGLNTGDPNLYRLADYMGVAPPTASSLYDEQINALPFAAYNLIYNEYYRDENLIAEVPTQLVDGAQPSSFWGDCYVRKRAWEHDYFTASLPFAQKGAQVDIPLGDVVLKDKWWSIGQNTGEWPQFWQVDTNNPPFGQNAPLNNLLEFGNAGTGGTILPDPNGGTPLAYDPKDTLTTSPTTINDLRRAFKLQEWLEKNARGGTRYSEHIKAHFGVMPEDYRLQRPEYITGIKTPVVISEVLNTTGTENAPQGDMAGHGVAVTTGKSGVYNVKEHGIIMGIISIMPKPAYQQGIPKLFLKSDFTDYYFPSFAHLGEQPVDHSEIYAYAQNPNMPRSTFGYVPRYAEYKYIPNQVSGDFRTTLNFWHMGRIFANKPNLNQTFIECDFAEVNRCFAVKDQQYDTVWMHVLNKVKAIRPMPVYGTPMI